MTQPGTSGRLRRTGGGAERTGWDEEEEEERIYCRPRPRKSGAVGGCERLDLHMNLKNVCPIGLLGWLAFRGEG